MPHPLITQHVPQPVARQQHELSRLCRATACASGAASALLRQRQGTNGAALGGAGGQAGCCPIASGPSGPQDVPCFKHSVQEGAWRGEVNVRVAWNSKEADWQLVAPQLLENPCLTGLCARCAGLHCWDPCVHACLVLCVTANQAVHALGGLGDGRDRLALWREALVLVPAGARGEGWERMRQAPRRACALDASALAGQNSIVGTEIDGGHAAASSAVRATVSA